MMLFVFIKFQFPFTWNILDIVLTTFQENYDNDIQANRLDRWNFRQQIKTLKLLEKLRVNKI